MSKWTSQDYMRVERGLKISLFFTSLLLLILILTSCGGPRSPGHVVLYGANWCPPCHVARPKLEQLASDLGYDFEYVQTDHWSTTNYYVPYIPRMLVETSAQHEHLLTNLVEPEYQVYYFGYPTEDAIEDARRVLGRSTSK